MEEIESIFLATVDTRSSYFREFLRRSKHDQQDRVLDRTLVRNFIYLLQTSCIDVSDLLLWILKYLCEDPRWMKNLQTHWSAAERSGFRHAQDLAHRVVLETLRLEQSEYLMRKALHDLHFEGFLIPKGWLVRIGVRESHRDRAIYEDPHVFNPDRFIANFQRDWAVFPFWFSTEILRGKEFDPGDGGAVCAGTSPRISVHGCEGNTTEGTGRLSLAPERKIARSVLAVFSLGAPKGEGFLGVVPRWELQDASPMDADAGCFPQSLINPSSQSGPTP